MSAHYARAYVGRTPPYRVDRVESVPRLLDPHQVTPMIKELVRRNPEKKKNGADCCNQTISPFFSRSSVARRPKAAWSR